MIPPSLILAVLVGSMIGLAFFYAFGRKADNMFVCWLVAVAAFLVGHLLGVGQAGGAGPAGRGALVEGTLASLLALVLMHFAKR